MIVFFNYLANDMITLRSSPFAREQAEGERERESSWINQPRGAHEIRLDETVRNSSRRRRKDDVWWAGKTLLLAEDQQCGTSSLLLILLLLPLHLYINTMSLLFFLLFSREKRGQTRNKHCRGIATHIVASRVTILSLSLSLSRLRNCEHEKRRP